MLAARGLPRGLETSGNPLVYGDLRVPRDVDITLLQPLRRSACRPEGLATSRSFHTGSSHRPCRSRAARNRKPEKRRQVQLGMAPLREVRLDDKAPYRERSRCATALDALNSHGGKPTWNVRVILDGEEEASSPSLVPTDRTVSRQASSRCHGDPGRSPAFERPPDVSRTARAASSRSTLTVFGRRPVSTAATTVTGSEPGRATGSACSPR